jgi:hypothetical protein
VAHFLVPVVYSEFFIALLADHAFDVEDGVPPLFAGGFGFASTAGTLHAYISPLSNRRVLSH